MFLLMGRTGPSSDIVSGAIPGGNTPNHPGAGADGFWSRHPGGCQFLLCDGSVRFIKETLTPQVFRALASRAGGEVMALINTEAEKSQDVVSHVFLILRQN